MSATATSTPGDGSPDSRPTRRGPWARAGLIARAVQVRLRFVVVLAVAFLVVGRWDALRNRWDQFTRTLRGGSAATAAVSSDTEYFCPMDPGVVSDWPGKCGVCNMTLVRRKKGEATPLPSGVVARMQFSPYRLQLAGVRTAPVVYEPLARASVRAGTVLEATTKSARVIELDADEPDLDALAQGQTVELLAEDRGSRATLEAVITEVCVHESGRDRDRLTVRVDDTGRMLREGTPVAVRIRHPVAAQEPFRSLPAGVPPLRAGESRSVYTCPEHAEVLAAAPRRCPVDGRSVLEPQPLLANQRVAWWCPVHPKVAAEQPGQECRECGGMPLVPRVITYRPDGQVLTVPESAVVDTGTRTVVFVERMPGMFDGVEVQLGPRCGDAYPVVSGLEPGQRVVTAGAFLIDAETRLNPALASAYFGASRSDRPRQAPEVAPTLRALADAQKICPVTQKPLGSMGPPVAVTVAGRTVLVCCDGCVEPLKNAPDKYLPRLEGTKAPAARP
jgi:hypothetical protein